MVHYRITHKSKHGGFWNGAKVMQSLETDDKEKAEKFAMEGHLVETIEQPPKKPKGKKFAE